MPPWVPPPKPRDEDEANAQRVAWDQWNADYVENNWRRRAVSLKDLNAQLRTQLVGVAFMFEPRNVPYGDRLLAGVELAAKVIKAHHYMVAIPWDPQKNHDLHARGPELDWKIPPFKMTDQGPLNHVYTETRKYYEKSCSWYNKCLRNYQLIGGIKLGNFKYVGDYWHEFTTLPLTYLMMWPHTPHHQVFEICAIACKSQIKARGDSEKVINQWKITKLQQISDDKLQRLLLQASNIQKASFEYLQLVDIMYFVDDNKSEKIVRAFLVNRGIQIPRQEHRGANTKVLPTARKWYNETATEEEQFTYSQLKILYARYEIRQFEIEEDRRKEENQRRMIANKQAALKESLTNKLLGLVRDESVFSVMRTGKLSFLCLNDEKNLAPLFAQFLHCNGVETADDHCLDGFAHQFRDWLRSKATREEFHMFRLLCGLYSKKEFHSISLERSKRRKIVLREELVWPGPTSNKKRGPPKDDDPSKEPKRHCLQEDPFLDEAAQDQIALEKAEAEKRAEKEKKDKEKAEAEERAEKEKKDKEKAEAEKRAQQEKKDKEKAEAEKRAQQEQVAREKAHQEKQMQQRLLEEAKASVQEKLQQEHQKHLEHKDEKIKQLSDRVKQLESGLQSVKGSNENLRRQCEEAQKQSDSNLKSARDSKKKLAANTKSLEQAKTAVQHVKKLEGLLNKHKQEIASLQSKNKALDKELNKARTLAKRRSSLSGTMKNTFVVPELTPQARELMERQKPKLRRDQNGSSRRNEKGHVMFTTPTKEWCKKNNVLALRVVMYLNQLQDKYDPKRTLELDEYTTKKYYQLACIALGFHDTRDMGDKSQHFKGGIILWLKVTEFGDFKMKMAKFVLYHTADKVLEATKEQIDESSALILEDCFDDAAKSAIEDAIDCVRALKNLEEQKNNEGE